MRVTGLIVLVLVGVGVVVTFLMVSRQQAEPSVMSDLIESGTPMPGSGQFIQDVPDGFEPSAEEDMREKLPEESMDVMMEEEEPTVLGEEVKVEVDETGFIPQTVTVVQGTKVVFVNNGQALHWPASDVHPTHEELPGFDAMHGLQTGETYSYTFDQVGDWSCHDHLMPEHTCTINVTSK